MDSQMNVKRRMILLAGMGLKSFVQELIADRQVDAPGEITVEVLS